MAHTQALTHTLFECCFVTVIDCIDCIQFLSSCILSVHVCLQLRSDVTFDLDLEHVLETFWDHCVEVGFFLIGLLVYFFNRVWKKDVFPAKLMSSFTSHRLQCHCDRRPYVNVTSCHNRLLVVSELYTVAVGGIADGQQLLLCCGRYGAATHRPTKCCPNSNDVELLMLKLQTWAQPPTCCQSALEGTKPRITFQKFPEGTT